MNRTLWQAAGKCDLPLLEQTLVGEYGRVSQEDLNDALARACERGYSECVERLIVALADPNAEDSYGSPVLTLAAAGGHTRVVRQLLLVGCDPNAMMDNGRTALHCAARESQAPIVLQLLRSGSCIVDCQDDNDDTPLMFAASNGNALIVQVILHQDADVNLKNDDGNTALHFAAESGDQLCCILIKEKHADINAVNRFKDTPLLMACKNGNDKAAALLAMVGSDVHAMDIAQRTPLHYAIKNGLLAATKALLSAGSMDIMDADHTTPLMESVALGQKELTRCLIAANFNVNAQGRFKRNQDAEAIRCEPLEAALRLGDLTLADLLVMAGASLRTLQAWEAGDSVPKEVLENEAAMSWVHNALEKPLPLMALSRLGVRNCLGFWPQAKLTKLKIPAKLMLFLNYMTT